MIRVLLAIMMSMGAFMGYSQITEEHPSNMNVTVKINNVDSNRGTMYYMIFDSEESFNKRKALKSSSSKIENGQTSTDFKNLKEGNYAVLCFHDVNDNQKMDFSSDGLPQEKYGVTNNIFNYGPPSFQEAKFEVKDTNLTFEIELIQL